jgi:hypothetical protein
LLPELTKSSLRQVSLSRPTPPTSKIAWAPSERAEKHTIVSGKFVARLLPLKPELSGRVREQLRDAFNEIQKGTFLDRRSDGKRTIRWSSEVDWHLKGLSRLLSADSTRYDNLGQRTDGYPRWK